MKIILDNEWYIDDSGIGYTLVQFKGKTNSRINKDGIEIITEDYDHVSYPPTIADCIYKYVRLSIVDKHKYESLELKDYAKLFKELYQSVVDRLEDIGISR